METWRAKFVHPPRQILMTVFIHFLGRTKKNKCPFASCNSNCAFHEFVSSSSELNFTLKDPDDGLAEILNVEHLKLKHERRFAGFTFVHLQLEREREESEYGARYSRLKYVFLY